MNHIYSVLWNQALGRFCVTSEIGRSRSRATIQRHAGQGMGLSARLPALALSVAMAWAMPAWSQAVLPQGAKVVSGAAQITTTGNQMLVQQGSAKAIVDWQSFHIGKGQQVQFQQPNAGSVALNRVVGADASAIHGTLKANGQVFLVNPNGVLFGAGANVNVGSLVASTLDISNENFLSGNYQFNGKGAGLQGGSVVNRGSITAAEGGAVALLGGTVSNQGVITARLGSVALAAGNQMSLDFAGDGLLNVQVSESAVNALADNQQLLQADGGSVLIAAKATDALLQTVVNHTGTVQAHTVGSREGKIVLLGGFNGGTTRVASTLDASAPAAGNGGFVETSGAHVQIEAGAKVTTLAPQGKSGTWLIDPNDYTVASTGGNMTGQQVSDALNNNGDFSIATATSGSPGGKGDIHINDSISWNANKLTLNAERNINVNSNISVNGAGQLDLNYGGGMAGNAAGNLNVNPGGRVDFTQTGLGMLAVNGEAYKIIKDLAELQNMNAALDGKYALGGSIDASASASNGGFMPIGGNAPGYYSPTILPKFTGVFDGLGHTINNLNMETSLQSYVGLFGYASNATLRNVGLVGGKIGGVRHTGALAGLFSADNGTARISNAYSSAEVSGFQGVGGLVGTQEATNGTSTIHNSYATGSVSTRNYSGGAAIGGLVGSNEAKSMGNVVISNSYATGNITSSYSAGGLVGTNMASQGGKSVTSNVYATGDVSGEGHIGGLVSANSGTYDGMVKISNAYSTGRVNGTSTYAGGLTGSINSHNGGTVEVSNAYWNIETSGKPTSAGGGKGLTSAEMFDTGRWTGFDFGATWGNAKGQTTPYLLGVAGNQVFNKNDLPIGPITKTNSPLLYSALLDVNQLQAVQGKLDGKYVLGNNIDANATAGWNNGLGFQPIGFPVPFTGVFDGLDHTISGLTINRPSQPFVGLFGYSVNATMRNVSLVGGSIGGANFVGALVGHSRAEAGGIAHISRVNTAVDVSGNNYLGGLVGYQLVQSGGKAGIADTHTDGRINATGGFAGGLIGHSDSVAGTTTISNASATGQVDAAGDFVGGLIGSANSIGTISNATASGAVKGKNYVGGLIGYDNSSVDGASIERSFASGSVEGQGFVGGLIGGMSTDGEFTLSNVSARGQVTATAGGYAGGLIGSRVSSGKSTLSDAYATGPVTATGSHVGGLVGQLTVTSNEQDNVFNVHATGTVTGSSHIGGLIGSIEDPEGTSFISNAYASGTVTGSDSVGGLVGSNASSSVKANIFAVYATGNVSGGGGASIGGLAGSNSGSISHAYATGNVSGSEGSSIGGFVGANDGSISLAYATGNVSGGEGSSIGGFVGANNGGVSNAYATGKVSGVVGSSSGGFVGANNGNLTTSYWNLETSGQTDISGEAYGLTTAQMFQTHTWHHYFGLGYYWGNADEQTTPYLLGMSGNQVFNKNDLPKMGPITPDNRPSLYTAILDVDQLQKVQNHLAGRYVLGNSIAASATVNWNENEGFAPIGNVANAFNGIFDGLGYAISDLTIVRPSDDNLGLFGYARNATLRNVRLVGGRVLGRDNVGGLVGFNSANGGASIISNTEATGDISGRNEVGGLVGYNQAYGGQSSIDRSHTSGNVAGASRVGGLVGHNEALVNGTADITHVYTTGTVAGHGGVVGGLVGQNKSSFNSLSSISHAYASGYVSGSENVGGLVGYIDTDNAGTSSLVNVYASAGVHSSGDQVGGLVGYQGTTGNGTASISHAYATGEVSGRSSSTGGLVGVNDGMGSVTDSYWNRDTTRQSQSAGGGAAKSSNEMKQYATFSGWDISTEGASEKIWRIYDGDTTPLLRSFLTKVTVGDSTEPFRREYDGSRVYEDVYSYAPDDTDRSQLLGRLRYTAAEKNAGLYTGTNLALGGLYSTQQGYDISYWAAKGSLQIDPKPISIVTGITAENRAYDGTTNADLKLTQAVFNDRSGNNGLLGNDELTVADGARGQFLDKNAGSGKTVNITGIALGGADAGNYLLINAQAVSKANITAKEISGTIEANGKTYDGKTNAVITAQALVGLIAGDTVAIDTNSVHFDSKNAGQAKRVTAHGLTGADADNYQLVNTTATAHIDKAEISSVGGITAGPRTYNAQTAVDLVTGNAVFNGKVAGDALSVAGAIGTMTDKHAGAAKQVDITGITLGGEDARNYSLGQGADKATTQVAIAKASITAVDSITAAGRAYNGSAAVDLVTGNAGFNGKLEGDALSVANAIGTMTDKHAGEAKQVNIAGITLGGGDARNYTLAEGADKATTQVAIGKASISSVTGITATNRTYNGNAALDLVTSNAGLAGKVTGDALSVANATGTMVEKHAGAAKDVNITGITLGGEDARNYTLAQGADKATTQVTIGKAIISSVAGITAASRTYNGDTAVDLVTGNAGLTGKVAGDALSVAHATASMVDKHAGAAKDVNITGITLGGNDARNYTLANGADKATTQVAIEKASITAVDGITAVGRTYNGDTAVDLATANAGFTGQARGDALSVIGATGTMTDKHAGEAKQVNIAGISLGGDDARNYTLADGADKASTQVAIGKASISSIAGITATNRTYNGDTAVDLVTGNASLTGKLAGDALSVANAIGTMTDKHAGEAKHVDITGISLGGDDARNYMLAQGADKATTQVTIGKAIISSVAGITAASRTYNGDTVVDLVTGNAGLTGKVAGDALSVANATGTMVHKHAGAAKDVNITGITLGGADSRNYTLADGADKATTQVAIAKASITAVDNITAVGRTYNGSAAVDLVTGNAGLTGKVAGDALSVVGATGAMTDKHAGEAKQVDIAGITLGGDDARNYMLAQGADKAIAQVAIGKASITAVDNITVVGRTYNGSAAVDLVTGNASLTGKLAGDALSVANATGTMTDKHAGEAKQVNIAGITLGGDDARNYTLADGADKATTQVAIAKASITAVDNITAVGRTYNGSAAVDLVTGNAGLTGKVAGDALSVANATGAMVDKHAGESKAVNITGITLGGDDARNYALAPGANEATTQVDIAKASITGVAGITAASRTYNGDTAVDLVTSNAGLTGKVAGDALSVVGATGQMVDKHAGEAKQVNIAGITLGGDDARNYTLAQGADKATTQVDIAKASITGVAGITATNRTYNGETAVELVTGNAGLTGMVAGDALSVANATGTMVDKHAGEAKQVNITGITLGGDDARNYSLAEGTKKANTQVAIEKASIAGSITANEKTYDGTTHAVITAQALAGLFGTDAVAIDTGSGRFDNQNVGQGKLVTANGLTGADAGNYVLVNTTATAHVAPLAIRGTISADSKTYDGSTHAVIQVQELSGVLGGDAVEIDTRSGQFADKNAGVGKQVTARLEGTGAGNYVLIDTVATADIRKASLSSVSGIGAINRTYDGTTAATLDLGPATFNGMVSGDALTVATATGVFAHKNAGTHKSVAITGIALGGADAGNYTLTDSTARATADIDRLAISGSITADHKFYDGTTTATTHATLGGVLDGDKVALRATGSFVDAQVGAGKSVNITGGLEGVDAGNYRLAHNTTTVADIRASIGSGGGTVTPPDGGGTVTPPAGNGGTVTPPTGGGTVSPPAGNGGTVTPPAGGGTVSPPAGNGGTVVPPIGTGSPPARTTAVPVEVFVTVENAAHAAQAQSPGAVPSSESCFNDAYMPAVNATGQGAAAGSALSVYAEVGAAAPARACAPSPVL